MPSVPSKFLALRIHEEDEKTQARLERISLEELTEGEVVIKNSYSGINYKDALAVTGAGKILRSFPLVGGVDVAGTVAPATVEASVGVTVAGTVGGLPSSHSS